MTDQSGPLETPDEAIAARRRRRRPVTDAWVVRRRWIPRLGADSLWRRFRRRFRRATERTSDIGDMDLPLGCLDVLSDSLTAILAVVAFLLILGFVVFPLLAAVIDIALLIVLAVGGLVARVLFRRPWLIEARRSGGATLRWRVVGWRASSDRAEELRRMLEAGIVAPDAEVIADAPAVDD